MRMQRGVVEEEGGRDAMGCVKIILLFWTKTTMEGYISPLLCGGEMQPCTT